jgi:hypothetical protein
MTIHQRHRLANVNHRSTSPRPSSNLRPRSRRSTLLHRGRRPHTRRDSRMTAPPLPFNPHDHLSMSSQRKTNLVERVEMVLGRDGAADATGRADGPELVDVAVVLVPDFVGAAVGFEVPVAFGGGVVGWVVDAEGFHHVVFACWRVSPAIKGKVGVGIGSGRKRPGIVEFGLKASLVPFANYKVATGRLIPYDAELALAQVFSCDFSFVVRPVLVPVGVAALSGLERRVLRSVRSREGSHGESDKS